MCYLIVHEVRHTEIESRMNGLCRKGTTRKLSWAGVNGIFKKRSLNNQRKHIDWYILSWSKK